MHNCAQMKASNNGEKSQISRDLQRQIRVENGRLRENFRSKFRRKASNKAKKKKKIKKAIRKTQALPKRSDS